MFASNAATRMHDATRSLGRVTRGVVGLSLVVFVGAGLLACNEDFLTESPPNIIVPENLYTDLAGFQAGLNALYAQARKVREGASGTNLLMSEAWTVA